MENIVPLLSRRDFIFHEASITEPDFLPLLWRRYGPFEAVLHMAAVVSVPWSMEHAEQTLAVNYQATVNLHSAAQSLGAKAFVIAGSAAEYGRPSTDPVPEEAAGDPQSPYGLAKYLASCHVAATGYGCALRFFNLYGPARGQPGPYDSVVRIFIDRALSGGPLTIYGDGSQTRDFVYVDDAVQGVLLAAGVCGNGRPLQGIYNVGSGLACTVLELATFIREISGQNSPIVFLPERSGDLRHSLADISRLKNEHGFVVQTQIAEGLRTTFRWFKEVASHPEPALPGQEKL